jgi:hypothetical protein
VIIPGADEPSCDSCSDEIAKELTEGPSVRCSSAIWQEAHSGDDVLARAAAALEAPIGA